MPDVMVSTGGDVPTGKVRVTRTSPLSKQLNSMDLSVEREKLTNFFAGLVLGLIQNIFPELNADEREFIKTGYTPEDWDKMFPPEEEA